MPNILDASGLRLNTYQEWLKILVDGYKRIYGDDINLDSASPDGQFLNLLTQILVDQGDLIRSVYASFDPDQAFGTTLDQRIGLNGIRRQGGSFSVVDVRLEITDPVNLIGLDRASSSSPPYTVQDAQGNKWQLLNSQTGVVPGIYTLPFRAAEKGRVQTVPNSITTQSTIVLGVKSVNNLSPAARTGEDEELDAIVKVRRQKSVALSSDGYAPSLESALKNIPGITDAFVFENDTPIIDTNGIPANSIWAIVDGSAPNEDIANVIYRKRNAGCGTFGSQQFQIPRKNQPAFFVKWDFIEPEKAFLKFSVIPIDPSRILDLGAVDKGILASQIRGPILDINSVSSLVRSLEPNALIVDAGFSNGRQQKLIFEGTPTTGTLELEYQQNSVILTVADLTAQGIPTKIKTIPGLTNLTITAVGKPLVVSITYPTTPLSMLKIKSSTLDAPIKLTLENTGPILRQSLKKNRLTLDAESIIINSITLKANDTSVLAGGNVNFSASGGYGSFTYVLVTNASGATINALTGLYIAGRTSGLDTIEAVDQLGTRSNQISVTVR